MHKQQLLSYTIHKHPFLPPLFFHTLTTILTIYMLSHSRAQGDKPTMATSANLLLTTKAPPDQNITTCKLRSKIYDGKYTCSQISKHSYQKYPKLPGQSRIIPAYYM